jgi:predicted phage terminase large subunit-like protein
MGLVVNQVDLIRSVTRESFYDFLKEFWNVFIPSKLILNWHVEFLCDELQNVAELVFANKPKEYDLIINISPGTTKSSICSVAFPAWVWTRRPDMRCICASYTDKLALDLSRKCRDIIKSEKYAKCYPDINLKADQDTKGYFINTKGGDRYCCGVGGSPMGFHAHFLIIDDPIDPMKALSEIEIKGANDWMRETLPTRKVDKDITPTILIMQRLHQNDPTGNRLSWVEASPVRHIRLPAELLDTKKNSVRPERLRRNYVEVIDPKTNSKRKLMDQHRLTCKALDEQKASLGQYGYAGQFLQDPVPLGGGMFHTDDLQFVDRDKVPNNFRKVVRYWDNAGTKDGGKFTAGVKMAVTPENRLYVLDVVRFRESSDVREDRKRRIAELDDISCIVGQEQEPGSSGKESAEATARRLIGFKVRLIRPTGDKTVRADPYSVQVNAKNVYLVRAGWNEAYIEEMKYFPHSTYKDQIDASSGAFALLTAPVLVAGAFR